MTRFLSHVCIFLMLLSIPGCSTSTPAHEGEQISSGQQESASAEQPESSSGDAEHADEYFDDDHDPLYEEQGTAHFDYDISEVYDAMCAACHGDQGAGDGPAGPALSFGAPADQWSNGPTVDGILLTLEDGIHDSAMRDFPEFKDVDRVELADYVIELRRALQVYD